MKKALCTLLAVVMLLPMLAACNSNQQSSTTTPNSASSSGQSEPGNEPMTVKTVRVSSNIPKASFDSQLLASCVWYKYFMDEVEKRSNGSIVFDAYWDAQLASSTADIINGLKDGAFEMSQINCGNMAEYTDALTPIGCPYLYKNNDVVKAVLTSEIGQSWMDQIEEDVGVKPIGFIDAGFRHLTNSRREVKTPADVKGLKIRTMSDPLMISLFEQLGASVTVTAWSETFTALQQGLIDGQENPAGTITSGKFYEVQSYMTLTGHSYSNMVVLFSKDFYESLTEEEKQLIHEVALEAQDAAFGFAAEKDSEYIATIESNGVKITDLTNEEKNAFRDAIKDKVWPMCAEIMGQDKFDELVSFIDKTEKELGL